MLCSLFMVLASQSLAVFGTAQQDLITKGVKYNGPSHHYLPTAVEHNQDIVPSTKKSTKQLQGLPQHTDCFQHRLTLQRQTIPGSQNSYQSQPATRIETDLQKPQLFNGDINQNSHHHSFVKQLSSPGYIEPIHTLYSSVLHPTLKPTAQVKVNETHYREVEPFAHYARKSKISILPETRQSKFQDTEYSNSVDLNEVPLPSQGYLPPYENLRQQVTEKLTTTDIPSHTSRYQRPINKNLLVSTESPLRASSPVYSFGNYPNNRLWNPINAERLTTTLMSQSTTLKPQTSLEVLRPGYRYNTPASRYLTSNSQSIKNNELGMAPYEISQHSQDLHTHFDDANGKTEIQTEQGYVYGQPVSINNKTYLNSVPTQPNPNQYYRQGPLSLHENTQGDLFQDEVQFQQSSMKDNDSQIKALSTKANTSRLIRYKPRLPASSYSIRNEDNRPHQIQQGHTVSNLGTFEEHQTSLNIQQYKQQSDAKRNNEKPSYLMDQEGPGESVESAFKESNQRTNDIEELQRRKEDFNNHNSGAVENIREATRYPTHFSPSAGPSHSDKIIGLHSYPSRLEVNHNTNKDLRSQPYSRLPNGSSGYNFGDLNQHSKPNDIPNNPGSLNGIEFGLSANQEKAKGNFEAPGQLTSGKQSPGSLNYEQQQSGYYSPVTETLQSQEVFASIPVASSNAASFAATPSITARPTPDYLSFRNQQHLPLPDFNDSYPTPQPIVNEQQIFPVSSQKYSQLWDTKSIRAQNSESLIYKNSNISPLPQEELQEKALIESLPYLSYKLTPPMTTIPAFHSFSSAGEKEVQSHNFYMSSNPSKVSQPDTSNNVYSSANHVATTSFNQTPLNAESQREFPQSPNRFAASKIVSGLFTPQVAPQQLIHSNDQQVFYRDHNPTSQGSIRLQTNAVKVHKNLGAAARNTYPVSLGVFPLQFQTSQSQTDSSNQYEGTNSLPFLRDTKRHFNVASYTPSNFGGNPKTSLESLANIPHRSVSSALPQTQQNKLKSYFNEPLNQSPATNKQFSIQNNLGAAGKPHDQELFLGNPSALLQNTNSSSPSNFIGSTGRVSNSSTIETNYKFDANSPSQLDHAFPSHSFSRNSFDIVNPIQESQRQNAELVDQPFNTRAHSNSKPMAFGEISYTAMSSTSRISPDTPLNLIQRKWIRQPHLVYGGPKEESPSLQV